MFHIQCFDSVAQLVEQQTLNLWVLSSNLSGVTLNVALHGATFFIVHSTGFKNENSDHQNSLMKAIKEYPPVWLTTGGICLQCCHIDHEPIPYIAAQHSFVRGGDVFDVDEFDIRNDIVFSAEIQHFLGFWDASDS